MSPTSESRITYACLISQYTVASAQVIRLIGGQDVIAVSTKQMADRGVNARFENIIKPWVSHIRVIGAGNDGVPPFPAESMRESYKWMQDYLKPLLDEARQKGHWLIANVTGGTKAAAMALDRCVEWDELHYTAEGTRDRLEVVNTQGGTLYSLRPLTVLDEAKLLHDAITSATDKWEDVDKALLRRAAERIHADYAAGREKSIIAAHENDLESLWFSSLELTNNMKTSPLRIEADQNHVWVLPGELQDLFAEIAVIDPNACPWRGDRLGIPRNRKHRWSRFVVGTWWEYLVSCWLSDLGVEARNSVTIERARAAADSEADILLRRKDGAIGLIECKVQPPDDNRPLTDMVRVLGDITALFGKTSAAFALSPAFWWDAKKSAAKAFREACHIRNFFLIENKDQLEQWVGRQDERVHPNVPEYVPPGQSRPGYS